MCYEGLIMSKSKSEKARAKKEALKLYDEGVISVARIAEIIGFNKGSVYRWLRERKDKKISSLGEHRSNIKIREEAFRLFDDGISGREVSRRLGVHKNTAYIWRDINNRNKNKIDQSDFDDNDILDMLREGLSVNRIRRRTGIWDHRINKIKRDAEREGMI
tara:strand:+ start:226 stop:708 length:483 start_codon:yes stop_codon:yes gene_type:complete